MSNTPANLKYTKDHEWVEDAGNSQVRVGITDYAQAALGDIVYIQLPKVGERLTAGKVCGEVESTKSVSEIYSPVSGVVLEVNSALDANPEVINSDPYGGGWIALIGEISAEEELMSAEEYGSLTA
jgi:glycine cleavage system H protein